MTDRYRFRAGDKVQHKTTGEQWFLSCDEDGQHVITVSPNEAKLSIWDLQLVDPATPGNSLRMLKKTAAHGETDGKNCAAKQLEKRGIRTGEES